MRCLGIGRSSRFSPNSVGRDAAILAAVEQELRSMGHEVRCVSEDEVFALAGVDVVFSMARSEEALAALAQAEEDGLRVLNSASALSCASRSALTRLFEAANLPIPKTVYLSHEAGLLRFPVWLKRGDACAQSAADVCFLQTPEELEAAVADFRARGIADMVVCEHVEGDLVKFYGVEGTDFFYFYYPTAAVGFSKFGLEKVNGVPTGYAFDPASLKTCADRAARLSGLVVYGGDCVVRRDGTFLLIDFNDWPSFSSCTAKAARAIARRVTEEYTDKYDLA